MHIAEVLTFFESVLDVRTYISRTIFTTPLYVYVYVYLVHDSTNSSGVYTCTFATQLNKELEAAL